MTRCKTGTGEDGQCGDEQSASHHQSINDRSLLILKIISRLNLRFPEETDVGEIVVKLHAEDEKSWDWLCDLGLIRGEPDRAQLTVSGKRVVEHASQSAEVRGSIDGAERLREANDKHAKAVLALLYANYEQRYESDS